MSSKVSMADLADSSMVSVGLNGQTSKSGAVILVVVVLTAEAANDSTILVPSVDLRFTFSGAFFSFRSNYFLAIMVTTRPSLYCDRDFVVCTDFAVHPVLS
jgi:hypothetical protein